MVTEELTPVTVNHQVDDHVNYEKLLQRRNLILLERKSQSWGARNWTESQVDTLKSELTRLFPTHNIVRHQSDSLLHPDFCYACEIMEMTRADIIIGIHGAGLNKQMFMPEGAVVFEITTFLTDVSMPVCGYFGNMANMFGHHHYLYAYNGNNARVTEQMNVTDVTTQLLDYYNYIHSYESAELRKPFSLINT